nr:MAG TPA: hypothetical protein [Caudoviricetes sp.]
MYLQFNLRVNKCNLKTLATSSSKSVYRWWRRLAGERHARFTNGLIAVACHAPITPAKQAMPPKSQLHLVVSIQRTRSLKSVNQKPLNGGPNHERESNAFTCVSTQYRNTPGSDDKPRST